MAIFWILSQCGYGGSSQVGTNPKKDNLFGDFPYTAYALGSGVGGGGWSAYPEFGPYPE